MVFFPLSEPWSLWVSGIAPSKARVKQLFIPYFIDTM